MKRRRRRKPKKKKRVAAATPETSFVRLTDDQIQMLSNRDDVCIYEGVQEQRVKDFGSEEVRTYCTQLRWDFEERFGDGTRDDKLIRQDIIDDDSKLKLFSKCYPKLFEIFTSRKVFHEQLDIVHFIIATRERVEAGKLEDDMAELIIKSYTAQRVKEINDAIAEAKRKIDEEKNTAEEQNVTV